MQLTEDSAPTAATVCGSRETDTWGLQKRQRGGGTLRERRLRLHEPPRSNGGQIPALPAGSGTEAGPGVARQLLLLLLHGSHVTVLVVA